MVFQGHMAMSFVACFGLFFVCVGLGETKLGRLFENWWKHGGSFKL